MIDTENNSCKTVNLPISEIYSVCKCLSIARLDGLTYIQTYFKLFSINTRTCMHSIPVPLYQNSKPCANRYWT